jgi:ubiquinone/menaquinone biosynthesis C-methylase UbiE
MAVIRWGIEKILAIPFLFELQQRLCNNYSAVGAEFAEILDRKDIRILDVGCSTATCAGQIIDMKANRYVGIDIEGQYIETARRRFADGEFLAVDARTLPFPPASFDTAMFIGVLHHMDDRLAQDCLAGVRRVVKPTGAIVIAEPVFTPGMWISNALLSLDRGRHIRSESGYRALFGDCHVERQRFFRFSAHRFCSFVLRPV